MSSPPFSIPLSKRDLCFIDIETTGSIFGYHEIIEIGAVRTSPEPSRLLGEWHRKVIPRNPDRISDLAHDLTQFSTEAWNDGHRSNRLLWEDFGQFASACVPVCHNPSFDRAFISLAASEADVLDLQLDYHWIGTESLAWPLYRKELLPKLSLEELCQYLGVPCEPYPHNALDGAHACRRAYTELMTRLACLLDQNQSAALIDY